MSKNAVLKPLSREAEIVLEKLMVDWKPEDWIVVKPSTAFPQPWHTLFRNDKPVHHFQDMADADAVAQHYMARYMLRIENCGDGDPREYRCGMTLSAVRADAADIAQFRDSEVEIFVSEMGLDSYEFIELVKPE